jgi:hypothetical protein
MRDGTGYWDVEFYDFVSGSPGAVEGLPGPSSGTAGRGGRAARPPPHAPSGPGSHRRAGRANRVPRRRRHPHRDTGQQHGIDVPFPGRVRGVDLGEGPRVVELGPLLHERAGLAGSFPVVLRHFGLFPTAATPRPAPPDPRTCHLIRGATGAESETSSPQAPIRRRGRRGLGSAGASATAKLHPAVKRSPEVTDLRPGAGRPGGADPGHGYGAVGAEFWAVAGNYSPGE